ncbi:Enoyl-(Acyl carrier protein) reductase [Thermomonospora echinospora]|uniref:Enoyl-(Acyl carrier protein) reductase n=1 Tax=Thermomonospora echinospora TaxID=1992 RepID=A0A1H6E041_9ACTN|nr:SDR family oxidoreductase [Thermomonospora echinospora]SEG90356.1 Enoyl-(Acyl carrier protein) reductase [Thermomonospora echinospora]
MADTATRAVRGAGALDADVVVVGAGPVGLLLAGDLAEQEVRTVVVEMLAEPMAESRASTLHARTMELLAERGVLERLGELPDGGPGHFGGIRIDLTEADPDHPYAGQWKCPQTRLEAVLQERAVRAGADLRRGWRLQRLDDRGDLVTAGIRATDGTERTLTAAYLVGCDGERSTVRGLAGFELAGTEARREMLRADIAGIDIPDRRFERLPKGLATAHRWPDGSTRVMVHVYGVRPRAHQGPPTFNEVAAAWAEVTGEQIGHGTPLWLNAFDDARRQVTRYRRGRVLLAGDAAHVQMPVGGQALNLGLQDAADLGGPLADRVAGRIGDDALDGYHERRHAVGARTLSNIQVQSLLLLEGRDVEPLREVFAGLLELGPVRRAAAGAISQIGEPATWAIGRPAGARPPVPGPPTARPVAPASPPARTHTPHQGKGHRMERLENKTALVTGSSRGIGRAVALRLAEEGALVAVHYATQRDAAEETVRLIEQDGGRAFAVQAELGVPGDVHELFLGLEHELKARTGETVLNILVNNAAITTPAGQTPEDVTPEDLDRLYAVNVKAPFFIVQRALPLLSAGGRIINVSSGLTRLANPEQVAYAMTKGAVEQITLHLARHLAPRGITVNTVAPGITNNGSAIFDVPEAVQQMAQLSAFKRVGEAADVADVIRFLATDEARWITGAFVDASGGTLLG